MAKTRGALGTTAAAIPRMFLGRVLPAVGKATAKKRHLSHLCCRGEAPMVLIGFYRSSPLLLNHLQA